MNPYRIGFGLIVGFVFATLVTIFVIPHLGFGDLFSPIAVFAVYLISLFAGFWNGAG